MKTSYLFYILIFYIPTNVMGQDVFSSSGMPLESDNYKLHFSLGETMVDYYSTDSLILTQGFIQVYPESSTSVDDEHNQNIRALIYPNPTHNSLIMESDDKNISEIVILDMNGRKVEHIKIDTYESNPTIDVSRLSPGSYIINLMNRDRNNLQSLKIIKTNNHD